MIESDEYDPLGEIVDYEPRKRPDWLVVGAESGPKARYCPPAWIRSIVLQCEDAGVPVFGKQAHLGPKEGFILCKEPSKCPPDLLTRQKPKEFSKDAKANAES
jgi:hypothetical protein